MDARLKKVANWLSIAIAVAVGGWVYVAVTDQIKEFSKTKPVHSKDSAQTTQNGQASTPTPEDTPTFDRKTLDEQLVRCLVAKVPQGQYSSDDGGKSAAVLLERGCPEEYTAWIDACVGAGDTEKNCILKSAIVAQAAIMRNKIDAQRQAKAYGDSLTEGLAPKAKAIPPVPGMPDLSKPVFVTKGSFVCDSPEALAAVYQAAKGGSGQDSTPVRAYLEHRMCAVVPEDTRITVMPPNDEADYLSATLMRYVFIEWENSDGSSYGGYAGIARLRN